MMEYLIEKGQVYKIGKTKTGEFKIYHSPEKQLKLEQIDNKIVAKYVDYLGNEIVSKDKVTFCVDGAEKISDSQNELTIVEPAENTSVKISASIDNVCSEITIKGHEVTETEMINRRMTALEEKLDLVLSSIKQTTK